MKRLLFILILFVNLQIVIKSGYVGLELQCITADAQRQTREAGDNCFMDGLWYNFADYRLCDTPAVVDAYKCDFCGMGFEKDKDAHDAHELICPDNPINQHSDDPWSTDDGSGTDYGTGSSGTGGSGGGSTSGNTSNNSSLDNNPYNWGFSIPSWDIEPANTALYPYRLSQNNNSTDWSGEYHVPLSGEILFKEKLPALSPTQMDLVTCVPTALAICYQGENLCELGVAQSFAQYYMLCYENFSGTSIQEDGGTRNIDGYFNFIVDDSDNEIYIYSINPPEIPQYINNNIQVLITVKYIDPINGLPKWHELVVQGYFSPTSFQCKDPADGKYCTIELYQITEAHAYQSNILYK